MKGLRKTSYNEINFSSSGNWHNLWYEPIFSYKQTHGGSYHESYKLVKERFFRSPNFDPLMICPLSPVTFNASFPSGAAARSVIVDEPTLRHPIISLLFEHFLIIASTLDEFCTTAMNSEWHTVQLGPGIVREKTLGGVTSFVPFSCQ